MSIPIRAGLLPALVQAFLLVMGGCDDSPTAIPDAPPAPPAGVDPDTVTLPEAYLTDRRREFDIDSPVAWRREDGSVWVFVTAKQGDVVLVHDGADGRLLRTLGGSGTGEGQFDRPNGVAVADGLLFVVERDNRRVQTFTLPDLEPAGMFGVGVLQRPYGIAVVETEEGVDVYVTDQDQREIPRAELLATRVKQFRVRRDGDAVDAVLVRRFGETEGRGALSKVESIYVDPARNRLLIADEAARDINVYTLDGEFTGREIRGYFEMEPEGIALYRCGDGGYWIATDQQLEENTFHVFTRDDFGYLGAFRGVQTRNTDGIAVIEGHVGPLEGGAFYAVHDDGNVAAFPWSAIEEALELDGC